MKLIALDRDYDLPSTAAGVSAEKASAILSQFERKKRAGAFSVPTDAGRVRARLREHGEPITLFGEGPAERRDRLRELLLREQDEAEGFEGGDVQMVDGEAEEQGEGDEEFYTEGLERLLDFSYDN